MFGEPSSEDSGSDSDSDSGEGLRGRALGALVEDLVERLRAAGKCLTGFNAPGLVGFGRWTLKIVRRVVVPPEVDFIVLRSTLDRLVMLTDFERIIARFSRDAIWAAWEAASLSALSRAASFCASAFLTLVRADPPMLRFFGEFGALDEPRPDPKTSCSLRLAPAKRAEGSDFSSLTGFFGLGPKTPRHDLVPHLHSWMFFSEKGLHMY